MKLPAPLSEAQRQRVQTALGKLQSAHATFEAKLAAFATATAEREGTERLLDVARRNSAFSNESARRAGVLSTQIGETKDRCRAAQVAMETARENSVVAIQGAGKIVRTLGAPLLTQFLAGLADALRPFCADPAAVAAHVIDRSEYAALRQFLQRGLFLTKHASAQDVEQLTFELGQTLQRILDGGEIWQLRGVPAPPHPATIAVP